VVLRDHARITSEIPNIIGAYVGRWAIDPQVTEGIMLTMNSVNRCSYCTGLHSELGRMSGVSKEKCELLNNSTTEEESLSVMDHHGVKLARIFASRNGNDMDSIIASYKSQFGSQKTASYLALCWFLHWGSFGGNTLNALFSRLIYFSPKEGSNIILEVLFTWYYLPLYVLIMIASALLSILPQVPKVVSSLLGVVLTIIASMWIVPLGILGMILGY